MAEKHREVTEYDDYKYEFIGKDSTELQAQAAAAKEEAIRYAREIRQKYGLTMEDLPPEE